MTALLTADEAARLRPGERLVIVRAGDEFRHLLRAPEFVAPRDWVTLTGPCPTCGGSGVDPNAEWDQSDDSQMADWPDEAWRDAFPCPDCRDGRRIVPLYTECPVCFGHGTVEFSVGTGKPRNVRPCGFCCCDGHVQAGRGSIEVVPVVEAVEPNGHGGWHICIQNRTALLMNGVQFQFAIPLDPLPVPGRDFGIVIDCVEVAS